MEKPRFNMLFVLNCLILLALVLSHIVPTIVLVFIAPGLLLVNPRWRSLGYLAAVAWWASRSPRSGRYPSRPTWSGRRTWPGTSLVGTTSSHRPLPGGGPGHRRMAFAIAKRESKLLPLAWITFITAVVYWVLPDGRLWNARVVPFFYFSLHLWAAYGTVWMIRPFTVVVHDLFGSRGSMPARLCPAGGGSARYRRHRHQQHRGQLDQVELHGLRGQGQVAQYQEINNFIASLSPPGG